MELYKEQQVLDFGTVQFNTKYKKKFEIKNNASISQVFKVEKLLDDVQPHSSFHVKPCVSPSIKPGKVFAFEVEFTPKYVNSRYGDYFIIKHSFGVETVLFTKATVEGPQVYISCTQLQMTCTNDKKSSSKKFELKNDGNSSVYFQFVTDNTNSQINISPTHGQLKPSTSVYITVVVTSTFINNFCCQFYKRVFCLIECHETLFVDIYALRLNNNEKRIFDSSEEKLSQLKNGSNYFMNNVMSRDEMPLVSVNSYYLDFESCEPKSIKNMEFSVTNNTSKKISLVWNQGNGKVFKVQPHKAEIDVSSYAEFSVLFKPLKRDMLYAACLEAQLFSSDQLLPFSVDIKFKGHSFEEASCGWAAQYKVEPSNVFLPPCTSKDGILNPTYTTLIIHRFGHLPLAYKFHPPDKTNFSVKPRHGLISEDFEIILVEFYPKVLNDAVYTEKWLLSFNSNETVNQCYVTLIGSVETPQIIINNEQDIVSATVHPKTPVNIQIDLFNPTSFSFWYREEVLKGEPVLMVESGGEIWPHEHKQVTWRFCPHGLGTLEGLVCCTPTTQAGVKAKTTTAVVRGFCEEAKLQVEPHGLLYQDILCNYPHERGFQITNIGEAFITSTFMWLPGDNCSPGDVQVLFKPNEFTLTPGSFILVNVVITPLVRGPKNIVIGYSVNDIKAEPLLPVFINSIFPCIQVGDICMKNTGPLFTKLDFWKTMQINQLNKIFEKLRPGETREVVNMYLPSFVCTSDNITVELLLENHSNIGANLIITQKKTCNCKSEFKQVSFCRSEWKDLCNHKTQVKIFPMSVYMRPRDYIVLHLEVSYINVSYVECFYTFSIVPENYEDVNCSFELCIGRTSIPEGLSHIDTTEPKEAHCFVFHMKSVYIGDCYPFVQGFNLYNNTKQSVFYEVCDQALINTPFKYKGKKNKISPLSNHTLLFTFLPSKCEMYEAVIEVIIQDTATKTSTKLKLRGYGILEKNGEDDHIKFPIEEKIIFIKPSPNFLSTSHFNVGPLKSFCTQKHVFFFNNSTSELISFKWHTTKLPDIMELRVHPFKGAVEPGSSVECRLFVYSKGSPCHLTSTLTCVFASFTQFSKMVRSIQKYRDESKTCANYFIITENGEEQTIELIPPKEEWPRKEYLTISVTINIKNDTAGDNDFLPFSPSTVLPTYFKESLGLISEKEHVLHIQVMERILWEALDDLCENNKAKRDDTLVKYIQLKEDRTDQSEVAVPQNIKKTVIEDLLYSAWQEIYQIETRNTNDHLRRSLFLNLQQSARSVLSSDESISKYIFPISESVTDSVSTPSVTYNCIQKI